MRTSNPALSEKVFSRYAPSTDATAKPMTLDGTVNKTGILLLCVVVTASFTWNAAMQGRPAMGLMMLGVFGGLIAALVTIFKKEWAPVSAPVYALCEGLFLGGISALYESQVRIQNVSGGIVTQAVGLTFGTLFLLLFLYKTKIIRVTAKFRMGVIAATGAIALLYLGSMIMGLFGAYPSFLSDSSPLSIGISLVIVGVAALNLVLDFDFIDRATRARLPKFMEWYAAFGLMVTLIWLYLELLRLLSKINNRR